MLGAAGAVPDRERLARRGGSVPARIHRRARLVLRRVAADDLPFFTRLHALSEVAEHLYPGGRPRSPDETAAWMKYTLASYEQLALGYLAVLRKQDGALIGRCGLMDMVVES